MPTLYHWKALSGMSGENTRAAAADFLAAKYDLSLRDETVNVVQVCVPLHSRPTAANPLPQHHIDRHVFGVFDVIQLLQEERKMNQRLLRKLHQLEGMLVQNTAEMRKLING